MWVLSSFMGNLPKHVQCKHIQMVSNGVMWYHPFNEVEEVCSSMPDELHLRLYLQLSLGIFLALRGVISTRFMGDWAWCQISGWYGWGKMKMFFLDHWNHLSTWRDMIQHIILVSNILSLLIPHVPKCDLWWCRCLLFPVVPFRGEHSNAYCKMHPPTV